MTIYGVFICLLTLGVCLVMTTLNTSARVLFYHLYFEIMEGRKETYLEVATAAPPPVFIIGEVIHYGSY